MVVSLSTAFIIYATFLSPFSTTNLLSTPSPTTNKKVWYYSHVSSFLSTKYNSKLLAWKLDLDGEKDLVLDIGTGSGSLAYSLFLNASGFKSYTNNYHNPVSGVKSRGVVAIDYDLNVIEKAVNNTSLRNKNLRKGVKEPIVFNFTTVDLFSSEVFAVLGENKFTKACAAFFGFGWDGGGRSGEDGGKGEDGVCIIWNLLDKRLALKEMLSKIEKGKRTGVVAGEAKEIEEEEEKCPVTGLSHPKVPTSKPLFAFSEVVGFRNQETKLKQLINIFESRVCDGEIDGVAVKGGFRLYRDVESFEWGMGARITMKAVLFDVVEEDEKRKDGEAVDIGLCEEENEGEVCRKGQS